MARQATPPDVFEELFRNPETGAPIQVDLDLIDDNPYQPRQLYDPTTLEELANSIERNGLQQPPAGRWVDGRMQLVFGHRRKRAFDLLRAKDAARWSTMPVFVVRVTDEDMAARAWAENVERADLTAIEQAQAIHTMVERFGWTQAKVAERLGLSAAVVSNKLRLLRAPEEVRDAVATGEISERQAASLMPVYDLPAEMQAKMARDSFYSAESLLAAAKRGKSSGDLRQQVDQIILQKSNRLEGAPFVDHDFGDGDWQARSCVDCTQRITRAGKDLCPIDSCYFAKSSAWQSRLISDAVAATGLQALPKEVDYTQKTTFNFYSAAEQAKVEEIYTAGCPNLRIMPSSFVKWSPPGTKNIELVCFHPGKKICSCMMAKNRAMTKDTRAQRKDLDQQAEPMLLEVLARGDLAVLRLVARHFKSDDAVQEWDAETCAKAILPPLVKSVMPWEPDKDPARVQKGWEKLLAATGMLPPWAQDETVEAVELDDSDPEPIGQEERRQQVWERVREQAVKRVVVHPSGWPTLKEEAPNGYIEPTVDRNAPDYIDAKLKRIAGWIDEFQDPGDGLPTPESVAGNFVNLERLLEVIVAQESEADQLKLKQMYDSIYTHLAALSDRVELSYRDQSAI